jgi:hypothetical protein
MTPLQHPRLREIAGYLDEVRGRLAGVVNSAPADRMGRVRPEDRWNGNQIVQHLGKVEGSTAKLLEGVFAKALESGLGSETETASLLGSMDRYASDGATLRPLVAPQRLRPDAVPDFAASWQSLQAVRDRTYRAFATVDGKDLSRVSAPHPFFGPLNAYQWLLFIGKHEERHLGQLTRELASP